MKMMMRFVRTRQIRDESGDDAAHDWEGDWYEERPTLNDSSGWALNPE